MSMSRVLRWLPFVGCAVVGAFLLSACNPPPTKKLIVTTSVDKADANVGDGVCEATVGAGDCTLRAAIQEANASSIRADVTVPPWNFTLTLGAADDSSMSGDLDIAPVSGSVVIHAPQPGARVSSGYGGFDNQLVEVRSGTVGITGLGVDPSVQGIGVDAGATLDLGAASAASLAVADGATAHVFDATIGSLQISGGVDVNFSTIEDLLGYTTSATATLSSSVVSHGCSIMNLSSGGYNRVVGIVDYCALAGPGDAFVADAALGAATGGHLVSRPPRLGSPALDAIPSGVGPCAGNPPTDEHGNLRPTRGACDIGATESKAPRHFTVDSGADAHDVNVGDGSCTTAAGTCSLRAAFDEVDRWVDTWDTSTVTLAADPTISLAGAGDDENLSGDLDLVTDLVVTGGDHRISAAGLDRAIDVRNGTVAIDHVTLMGGQADIGAGIRVRSRAAATLSYSSIIGNHASSRGGGAAADPAATITIDHSAVLDNAAGDAGGGVSAEPGVLSPRPSGGGQVTIDQSTLGGNSSPTATAVTAGDQHTSVVLRASTVVATGSGTPLSGYVDAPLCFPGHPYICEQGGHVAGYGTVVVSDTTPCGPNVGFDSYSVVNDPRCVPTARAAVLRPLADNGGPTRTYLPYSVSPGVDLIPQGTPELCDSSTTTDQRGATRPQGSACDAGAVEGSDPSSPPPPPPPPPPKTWTVTGAADKNDLTPGDGVCEAGGGCTLRAAIEEANRSTTTANTIVIKPGVNPKITRAGSVEDANGKGDFDIKGSLVIEGNGATVDGGQLDRVFDHFGGTLTIRNLTITGGKITGASLNGGGIRSTGNLVLDGVTVTGNAIVGDGAFGGGVADLGGTVSITGSTFSGNTLSGSGISGAGLGVSLGNLTVRSTTFSGNTAGGYQSRGGALMVIGTQATVWNSTLTGNTAFAGSAFDSISGTAPNGPTLSPSVDLRSSTVAGNHGSNAIAGGLSTTIAGSALSTDAGWLCVSQVNWLSYNVVAGDLTYCPLVGTNTQVSDLLLGPLAANGGPTQTLLPQTGSPLVDRIPVGTAWICDANLPTDQRGSPRPNGPACDAGSVER